MADGRVVAALLVGVFVGFNRAFGFGSFFVVPYCDFLLVVMLDGGEAAGNVELAAAPTGTGWIPAT